MQACYTISDGLEEDSAAGVPEKNMFDITVVRGASLAAGQYKLKIHYIPVDVYLDDIKVFKEGSAEAAEFTNGELIPGRRDRRRCPRNPP